MRFCRDLAGDCVLGVRGVGRSGAAAAACVHGAARACYASSCERKREMMVVRKLAPRMDIF